ncbi:MAG: sulfatase/phosphatase domain-containing protein [Bacteroidota bacterium]
MNQLAVDVRIERVSRIDLRENLSVVPIVWLVERSIGTFFERHTIGSAKESIRVPLVISGPGIRPMVNQDLVLNIDIFPTLLAMLGKESPPPLHGVSLLPVLTEEEWPEKRAHIYYQAPTPQLGSQPLAAIRTQRYKYIETYDETDTTRVVFQELYDLQEDPYELNNLAVDQTHNQLIQQLKRTLQQEQRNYH